METQADNVRAFVYAVGLHLLCGLLAFSGLFWWQTSKPVQAAGDPMQAVFVDIGSLAPPRPAPPQAQRPPPPPPPPDTPQPPATDPTANDPIEQQRIDQLALQQAEEDAREQEEQRRRAEQILLEEEEERRREEEQQRQREVQQQREREAREQAEAEAQAQAELEAQEQAEREAAEREAAEQAARLAGSAGEDTGLQAQYSSAIQRLVTSHWSRPDTAQPGLVCAVRIIQIPGGDVLSATVVSPCNADEITRRSIEAAVLRAQPLPYSGFESVFSREVTFRFRYGN